MKLKAIFLTNKSSLYSPVTGGVQLCSQEFLEILKSIKQIEVEPYYVSFTKNIIHRIQIKIGFENYSMYDVNKDKYALIDYIKKNDIKVVFINMASLVRYSKIIKEYFGQNVLIIMMSHGNHSGDFIHLISKPIHSVNVFRNFLNKIRLGLLLSTESIYRVKYLDGVVTLSETEKQIENWFGAKNTLFIPRRLNVDFLAHKPVLGRIGFVGRLDHPPNLQGLEILLNALKKVKAGNIEIRLIGKPENYGYKIASLHPSVTYLGELSDVDLEKEASTWALQLNPVWWYSTGASTKLAKAISWGIPILTTTAGMRGYMWERGELLVADTTETFCACMIEQTSCIDKINKNSDQTKLVAKSGFSGERLGEMIYQKFISEN
jgi:glycosyltransferase involved in cell wall biosynthesis